MKGTQISDDATILTSPGSLGFFPVEYLLVAEPDYFLVGEPIHSQGLILTSHVNDPIGNSVFHEANPGQMLFKHEKAQKFSS